MSVKRYVLDENALMGGMEMFEDDEGEYVLHSDYAALLARHNALREAIHKAMDRTADCDKKQTDKQLIADVAYLKRLAADHFKTSVDCGNRAFVAEQKYDALREAVAWERECRDVEVWMDTRPWSSGDAEIWASLAAARAEVDRLIAGETSADCKGEG